MLLAARLGVRWPRWQPGWWALAPLATFGLTLPATTPHREADPAGLLLGLGLTLGAALFPPGVAFALQGPRRRQLVAVPLVAFLAFSAVMASERTARAFDGPDFLVAEHAWNATLAPEGDAPFVARDRGASHATGNRGRCHHGSREHSDSRRHPPLPATFA